MRVKYLFSSRHTRRARVSGTPRKKKFFEIISKLISESDILIQVLDARFIQETINKTLEKEIIHHKKKIIYAINKLDLINLNKTKKVNAKLLSELYPYVFISSKTRQGIKELRNRIKIEASKISNPTTTIGVVGYPNTGKSSLINILIGRGLAGVAQEAGFTKGIQKAKLTPKIYLIDSPGIISEEDYKESNLEKMNKQIKINSRTLGKIKDPESFVDYLVKNYPKELESHYKLKFENNSEILLEELGRKKGFLKKGNRVDTDKTAKLIITEWQEGKIKLI